MTTIVGASTSSAVDRRLERLPFPVHVMVPLIGSVILFTSDTQSLSVVPLVTSIEQQWGLSATQLSWGLSILGLVAAAAVPTLSRLGDIIGMRRLLLLSMSVSTVGILLCALAHSFPLFVAGRALMGFSAASAFVYALTREKSRTSGHINRGVGIFAIAIAVGIGLSYFLAGIVLVNHGSVNVVFWIMFGISLVSLLLSWLYMPDNEARARIPLDFVGAGLLIAGLVCVVLGINQGSSWGWSSATILALLVIGVALLAALVGYELQRRQPMLDMRVLSRRTIWPGVAAGGITGIISGIAGLTFSEYLETPKAVGYGFGYSVWHTSLWFEVYAAATLLSALSVPWALRHLGIKGTLTLSGVVTCAAFLVGAFFGRSFWSWEVAMCFYGTMGPLANSAASSAFLQAARRGETGLVNAASMAALQGLSGIGPAIFTAILISSFIPHTPIPSPGNYNILWIVCAVFGAGYIVIAIALKKPTMTDEIPEGVELITPGSGVGVRTTID